MKQQTGTVSINKQYQPHILILSIACLLFIFFPFYERLYGDTIIFHHGDKLKIQEYEVRDDYIVLKLTDVNEISIPVAWIKEIRIEPVKSVPQEKQKGGNDINHPYLDMIKLSSKECSIDWKLIYTVIKYESGFNTKALSPKGAMGLMQLMPETAQLYKLKDPFNPEENIKAGVKHLSELLNLFENDISLALAAYNAGKEKVKQYNGIPPYRETQQYVKNILNFYNKIRE